MIQFNYTLLYNIIMYNMSMTMYYNLLYICITGNYILYITLLLLTLFPIHYWSIKLSFHLLNIGVILPYYVTQYIKKLNIY